MAAHAPAPRAQVVVDPHNPRAQVLLAAVQGAGLDLDRLDTRLHLVVGGDGFMLRTIRQRGPDGVFLGLNAGHLGFLLNDVRRPAAVVAALHTHRWTAHAFPRLALQATPDTQAHAADITARAVNDLYVERATGQTAHLRLLIDGEVVVERLICDGILVSTALGSTAYSYSAGGVPSHPLVRALQVTPISPHQPRLAPMMLPVGAVVEVEAVDVHRRPVRAVADGVDLGHIVRMRVENAEDDVQLAFLEGHSFTRALVDKVLRT